MLLREAPATTARRERQPEPAPRTAAAPTRQRLGYKRERALAELPRKIDALHAEIGSLQQALADVDLYRRDAAAFAAKTSRLGAAQAELDAAETEWLELELLREELEG